MNRSELIERLAAKSKIDPALSEEAVRILFDRMRTALSDGKRVEIRGFGSFSVREYKSYKGRNPKTGETIEVKPKKLPFFKLGKELKDRLNKSSK